MPPKAQAAAMQAQSRDEWTLGLRLAGLEVPPLSFLSSSSGSLSAFSKVDKVHMCPTAFAALTLLVIREEIKQFMGARVSRHWFL